MALQAPLEVIRYQVLLNIQGRLLTGQDRSPANMENGKLLNYIKFEIRKYNFHKTA